MCPSPSWLAQYMRFDFPFASFPALLLPADLPLAARSASVLGPFALAAPRGTRDSETMEQDGDLDSVNTAAPPPPPPPPSHPCTISFPVFTRSFFFLPILLSCTRFAFPSVFRSLFPSLLWIIFRNGFILIAINLKLDQLGINHDPASILYLRSINLLQSICAFSFLHTLIN